MNEVPERYSVILNDSKFFALISKLILVPVFFTVKNTKNSFSIILIKRLKQHIFCYTVQSFSVVIISAISTNIILFILTGKMMPNLHLFIQIILLFICAFGLFSRAKWDDIKNGSFLLRYLRSHREE